MRNLKRVLSLAMASVMLLGMMVVGSSAASFPDSDKIQNADAVNTLVSLGIIKGKDDGNFDPEGIVTRAEMAKMICVALNKGKDPNLSGGGLYPDTKGHWASGYIDYCTNLGIVAGDNKGNFNPNNTVTGVEAAKMILIAIGYNAEAEGFVNNARWDLNIGTVANTKGLYEDLSIVPTEGLTRDNAAQMIMNGLNATLVEYDYKVGAVDGNVTSIAIAKDKAGDPNILSEKFDMQTAYGYITNVSYNDTDEDYDYTMSTTGITDKPITFAPTFDQDRSDLFGMKVKVLYKNNSAKDVYGIYATDSSIVVEGVVSDIGSVKGADTSIKVDGTSYKLENQAATTNFVDFNTSTKTALTAAMSGAYSFKALDNNGNGKIDLIVVYPFTVEKITYVSKDYVTVGTQGSKKLADINAYDGIAKDDFAIVTAAVNTVDDTIALVKAETVTGKVDATKGTQVRVDGTWYEKNGNSLDLNSSYDLAVVNGYIYNASKVSGTALTEVLYVAGSSVDATTATNSAVQSYSSELKGDDVKVILADGTTQVVKAARDDVYTAASSQTSANKQHIIPAPGLYTYSINSNGVYLLKAIKEAEAGGSTTSTVQIGTTTGKYVYYGANKPTDTSVVTGAAGAFDEATDKLDGRLIADEAVVYVADTSGDGTHKVITGKTLKSWGSDYTSSATTYLTKSVSGLTQVICVAMAGSAGVPVDVDSTGYGYVTSSGIESKVDNKTQVTFKVWDGEDEVELTDVSSSLTSGDGANAKYKAGSFVTYNTTTTSGEVTGVTSLDAGAIATGMQVAITGFDGKNVEYYNAQSASFKDDDKTVVIYVDTANGDGVRGGEIQTAMNPANGVYVTNAIMKVTSGKVDVVFYDVANKLDGANYTLTNSTSQLSGTGSDRYDATLTPAAGTVKGGATIQVDVKVTSAAVATAKTITLTLTGADGTVVTQTVDFAKGELVNTVHSVYFEMPYANATLTWS